MKEEINEKKKIASLLAEATGNKEEDIESLIEVPPKMEMGDYAFPCFSFAKSMKKSPAQIAMDISKKANSALSEKNYLFIERVESTGPYLNFFLKKGIFAEKVLKEIIAKGDSYGSGEKKKDKVMVEFSDPNTHKAFHIGHLRNASIGDSLVRVMRFSGYNVTAANYIGDVGAHVGKCLWALEKFHSGELGKIPKNERGEFLGQVYTDATKRIAEAEEKKDSSLKEEAALIAKKLEEGDSSLTKLWKETREWSIEEFKRIYRELGINFDIYFFESEVEKKGKEIVSELLKKKIAEESRGAIIVDLKKYNLDVFLILRTDKTALYATKDLGLAEDKFRKYEIDRSIYVVGSEQKMYFQQLFKTLELMGFPNAKKCYHLAHELVMLEEGKMSSREGNVVTYGTLASEMMKKAESEIEKRHPEWAKKEKEDTAKKIAIAAMKFSMLNQDNNKPIIFSIVKALDFEGETASYVQYACTRASSILRKEKEENKKFIPAEEIKSADLSVLNSAEESALIRKLSEFPSVISKATEEYKPFIIPKYLLELSKQFSIFYRECQIMKAEEKVKKARLILTESARTVIANGLSLIGIPALERM
ncbi:MAG: arginine--tRNA ligase [Candidatus Woesearchaeota archaeon]|nr:arginine--tRNA ligase [Candidatus Woesearchaeota archaeon]